MNMRLDSIDGPVIMARAAEYNFQELIRAEYPERKGRNHVPVNFEGGPGARYLTRQHIDYAGRARLTSRPGYDTPKVDLLGAPDTIPVYSAEQEYEINFQEAREAMFADFQVSSEKAMAAGELIRALEDEITYLGAPSQGIHGLFSSRLPRIVSTVNFNDPALSADNAVDALTEWANAIYTTLTKTVLKANAVIMPSKVLTYMLSKRRSEHDPTTVMRAFKESNPWIDMIDDAVWCDIAGAGETPAMLFYNRDPRYVEFHIPHPLEQLVKSESQVCNTYLVHERIAGIRYKNRLSAVIVEGFWY